MIDWGDYIHLVPLKNFQAFCDSYNRGVEPEQTEGRFLKSRANGSRTWPTLPAPWGTFLRPQRGHGAVTDLLEEARATISLGRTDGLKTGDGITARSADGSARCAMVVLALADRTAKVRRLDPDSQGPEVGWTVLAPWLARRD